MTNQKSNLNYRQLIRGLILNVLFNLPIIVGMGIILASKGPISSSTMSLSFFIAGFTGLIIVIRKEIPTSIMIIRGKRPVIEGLILLIFLWGSAIYFALFGFEK